MFALYPLYGRPMFALCSLYVRPMVALCSLYVRAMFAVCSRSSSSSCDRRNISKVERVAPRLSLKNEKNMKSGSVTVMKTYSLKRCDSHRNSMAYYWKELGFKLWRRPRAELRAKAFQTSKKTKKMWASFPEIVRSRTISRWSCPESVPKWSAPLL